MAKARSKKARERKLRDLLEKLRSGQKAPFPPDLGSYAYRFTIYLPLLTADGKEVFSDVQIAQLEDLLRDYFGGFSSTTREGQPPWFGSWIADEPDKPIKNQHTLLVIYSLQNDEAIDFFRQLKWILERPHVAGEKIVLFEYLSVKLLRAKEMT